jgi:OPT family oligopeptide transporter
VTFVLTCASYDNTGKKYNITRVLTPELTLDKKKYSEYSPLFLPTTFALQYGLSFATISALIVHCALFYGKDIVAAAKNTKNVSKDVHTKLYERYKEPSVWWYVGMFAIFVTLGVLSVVTTPLKEQLPVWAFFFALLIAAVFIIPVGMIYSITNLAIGLNVFTEMIISYMLPGRPMAMMTFKTFGYITMNQGMTYAQDQKLAV